jgi:ubiquitin carboxyl-terminal hydrolase 7
LYLPVKVITEENFKAYQGFDLTAWDADSADPAAPRSYRTLRTMTIGELTGRIAEDIGKEADHLRLWVMVNRQNKTVRPDQPLVDSLMTIEDAHAKFGTKGHEFRIWIEEAAKFEGGKPVWPEIQHQPSNNSQILIFAKHFDAEAQTLKGAGYFYMRKHDKVPELAAPILQLMGWSTGVSLKLYEVCTVGRW